MKQAGGRDVSSVNLSGEFVSCMANTYWVFLCKIVTLKVCGPHISKYFVFVYCFMISGCLLPCLVKSYHSLGNLLKTSALLVCLHQHPHYHLDQRHSLNRDSQLQNCCKKVFFLQNQHSIDMLIISKGASSLFDSFSPDIVLAKELHAHHSEDEDDDAEDEGQVGESAHRVHHDRQDVVQRLP